MERNVYTVSQINRYIKNMFEQDFFLGRVSVSGEVSNLKYHSSGHIYFTLKEENCVIACVMFARQRRTLLMRLQEGQKLIVTGKIDVYERDGKYQLYAETIEDAGEGRLFAEFERLKARLSEMGMFDAAYKQPIPKFARTIGIVTAPTGAAVRDIISVSKRRNPYVRLLLYPALVQGEGAAESIVRGLCVLEEKKPDLIIVGRGGGSIEDLWAFNEEAVARAIFECSVPVISAVGHETDFTIADFVADLRAPTPSAAAEMANPDVRAILSMLEEKRQSLYRTFTEKMEFRRWRLKQYGATLARQNPVQQWNEKRMRLLQQEEQMEALLRQCLKTKKDQLTYEGQMFQTAVTSAVKDRKNRLSQYAALLKHLSPYARLASGFAVITDAAGRRLSSVRDVEEGMEIKARLADGVLTARVSDRKEV